MQPSAPSKSEAMVTEGFWWLVLCHKSMLYKRCTKQMWEPFIHVSHLLSKRWTGNHSHLARVSMQFLSEPWVLRLPDTDLHKCTHAHLWAWVAHWQSSRLQNTTTHGCHISSQPRSQFPNGISFQVIFTLFFRLTLLQTYVITVSKLVFYARSTGDVITDLCHC